MTATVSVLVPLQADPGSDRALAWEWLARRWVALHPEWELSTGGDPTPGPWSKARAVADALERSNGDVLVIADADVLVGALALLDAVALVEEGHPWVMPFGPVYRLAPDTTARVVAGDPTVEPEHVDRAALDPLRPRYKGKAGGGIVVVGADLLRTVGGFDPGFVGWGGEDLALAAALTGCAGGPVKLADRPLWHLWHEPQPDFEPSGQFSRASARLLARYRGAMRHPGRMRALVAERTGGDAMGCGCNGTTPEAAALPRTEAKCLTCGVGFTDYEAAQAHRDESSHVIEGLRALRAYARQPA